MKKESYSRIKIDDDLKLLGWDILDENEVQTEYTIRLSDEEKAQLRKSFLEVDYVLKDTKGIPVGVIEAKKQELNPVIAKKQAQTYARLLDVRFVYLSNGNVTYYFDREIQDQRVQAVSGFPTQSDLMELIALKDSSRVIPFEQVPIDTTIAGGFDSSLPEPKERYYQGESIDAVCNSIADGKKKILLHMATGLGKTRVSIALVKRLIETNRLNRCLFLVDRIELAKQTYKAFDENYKDATKVILRSRNLDSEKHKQIHICTLQTLVNYYKDFRPTFYDLVIVDECHRSIYGKHRMILDHFMSPIVGLTATPKFTDPKRNDLDAFNTYKYFECENREPDYQFDMTRGIKEKFLAPYKIEKITTYLTELALDKDKGIEIDTVLDPETGEKVTFDEDQKIFINQFQRKFISRETCKRIAENIKEKTQFGEKMILFAVSQAQAVFLAEELNKLFPEYNNDRYQYAEAIINANSDINAAMIDALRDPHKPPYIGVSVDILTTGVDLPCLRYIGFARRTKSAVLYTQMRGRGTRFDKKSGKLFFTILDFVNQTGLMNDEDSRGDIEFGPNEPPRVSEVKKEETGAKGKYFELLEDDPENMIQINYYDYTKGEVEYVDKVYSKQKYVEKFEENVKKGEGKLSEIVRIFKQNPEYEPSSDEAEQWEKELQKPQLFITEGNLQKAYGNNAGSVWDFIKHALGVKKVPTVEERVQTNYETFVSANAFNDQQRDVLLKLSKVFVANNNQIPISYFQSPLLKNVLGYSKGELEQVFEGRLYEHVQTINETFA